MAYNPAPIVAHGYETLAKSLGELIEAGPRREYQRLMGEAQLLQAKAGYEKTVKYEIPMAKYQMEKLRIEQAEMNRPMELMKTLGAHFGENSALVDSILEQIPALEATFGATFDRSIGDLVRDGRAITRHEFMKNPGAQAIIVSSALSKKVAGTPETALEARQRRSMLEQLRTQMMQFGVPAEVIKSTIDRRISSLDKDIEGFEPKHETWSEPYLLNGKSVQKSSQGMIRAVPVPTDRIEWGEPYLDDKGNLVQKNELGKINVLVKKGKPPKPVITRPQAMKRFTEIATKLTNVEMAFKRLDKLDKVDALVANLFPDYPQGQKLNQDDKAALRERLNELDRAARSEQRVIEESMPGVKRILDGQEVEVLYTISDGVYKVRSSEGQIGIFIAKMPRYDG